jgi:hypothetical protein
MSRNATPGPEKLVDDHQIRAEVLYMRGIAQCRSDSECSSLECATRRGRPVQAAKPGLETRQPSAGKFLFAQEKVLQAGPGDGFLHVEELRHADTVAPGL